MTDPFPPGRRDQVLSRDYYECQANVCEPPAPAGWTIGPDCAGPLVIHHIRPKRMGGTTDPTIHDLDNLVTLCDSHHRWVHEHPDDARTVGLLV